MSEDKTLEQASPEYLDQLIDEREAARFIGYSVRTLQNWRLRGGGPQYSKISKRSVRYRRRHLLAWADNALRSNTSDQGGNSWGQ
ncbi:helix-turn-helix transcriptional regulator [Thalassobaculum litoreum]|uniref:helix-turn-helix transcriptional regulator n=1 Tax=Thalassobaculum litoreum TaxID=420996 RepID=UPI000B83D67E|nr:helix-turn-helix domain-containing protein [Thalassobaculum litoreum]